MQLKVWDDGLHRVAIGIGSTVAASMKILIGVATQPQTKRVKDKGREIQEEKTNTDTEGNNNSF